MQTLTDSQRGLLAARHLVVDYGAELLDDQDQVVDPALPLTGGEVSRDNYAAVHGACQLDLQAQQRVSSQPPWHWPHTSTHRQGS